MLLAHQSLACLLVHEHIDTFIPLLVNQTNNHNLAATPVTPHPKGLSTSRNYGLLDFERRVDSSLPSVKAASIGARGRCAGSGLPSPRCTQDLPNSLDGAFGLMLTATTKSNHLRIAAENCAPKPSSMVTCSHLLRHRLSIRRKQLPLFGSWSTKQ